jgi:spoIIIJ-associated protein
MESIEVTAKTLDDASEEAAKLLGTSVEKLKITVLEHTKGLFGKGSVRIRAESDTSEAPAPKPKTAARGRKPRAEPAEAAPVAVVEAPDTEEVEAQDTVEVIASEQDGEQVLGAVQSILETTGLSVSARITSLNGRYVNVELDGQGKELGYLVGKNGEVLNALQYLLNIVVAQKLKSGVRLTLDANNYRARREAALNRYAEQIASEVRSRREEAVLDPLPAFERRIIHKALAEMQGVTTYSEGEEPNRRVVIAPTE